MQSQIGRKLQILELSDPENKVNVFYRGNKRDLNTSANSKLTPRSEKYVTLEVKNQRINVTQLRHNWREISDLKNKVKGIRKIAPGKYEKNNQRLE